MLLIAKVKQVIFTNGDYHVVSTNQGIVCLTCKGKPKPRKTYQFKGEKSKHKKYGNQFKADSFKPFQERKLPSSRYNALFGSRKFDSF